MLLRKRATLTAPHSALTNSAFIQQALALAKTGVGRCAPNPTVGCVIVKDGEIIGQARTANGGRPHAETQALAQAGEASKGATAYVTLEPCTHHGQTPPCVDAIIEAGIAHVMVACTDPYVKVDGSGIQKLRDAGIKVEVGLGETEAIGINRGFFSRVRRLRPWITLKTATSSDGFIAKPDGTSKWITSEEARNHGHSIRAQNDAILTGSGTYLYDEPQLTCRLKGLEDASPARYVLDRRGQIEQSAFTILRHQNLTDTLRHLADEGVNYLMVEAGAELSLAFLQEGLIDELYWYRAPTPLEQGIEAFRGAYKVINLDAFKMHDSKLGSDTLTVYRFTDPQSLLQS